jgi:hypothetical protein
MITVYNRNDYDCCTAMFTDETSTVRIHFHKANNYGTDIRQISLVGEGGPVIDLDFIGFGGEDCDAWR